MTLIKKLFLYVFLGLMFCNVSSGTILSDILKKFGKTPPACMKGDCDNGFGTYAWENGDIYVGEFKDGYSHGQGTYTRANGDKYSGEHKDGFGYGQGTATYADGSKYSGEWKDDQKHGQGTLTNSDGTVERGIWKNNKLVEPN